MAPRNPYILYIKKALNECFLAEQNR